MVSQAADARIQRQVARLTAASSRHRAVADYALRLDDLLQLVRAHHAVGGTGAGRRRGLDAVDRAALVMLTGHFQGFVSDLFVEVWGQKFPGSPGEALLARLRFNNPWPDDIDRLFEVLGHKTITKTAEARSTADRSEPPKAATRPTFVRKRKQHQVRQVIAEMVGLRNAAVHGGAAVQVKLGDVTRSLIDAVTLAIRMSATLEMKATH